MHEVMRAALSAGSLTEAVALVKAGAPREWLLHAAAIESNLERHLQKEPTASSIF